ncbi:MAG: zinc ribbon domain-containing protein [Acidobacteriota bacterium]
MSVTCVSCHHDIDDAAKLCPYCGADPRSGEKIDTQAILQEVFKPKNTSRSASVIDFARQRQGAVVAIAVVVGFLILAGLYQYAVHRNDTAALAGNGVPITEVTDISDRGEETKPLPMPPLQFAYDGRPQTMRTYIVEPGAAPAPAASTAPPAPPTAR